MATRNGTLVITEHRNKVFSVTGLLNGDQSQGVQLGAKDSTVCIQATGTFGVGGSIQLEESNDGTNFFLVGTALTAAGTKDITCAGRFLRFNVTAGDGTTSLVAVLCAHPLAG